MHMVSAFDSRTNQSEFELLVGMLCCVFDLESSALTMKPLCLPVITFTFQLLIPQLFFDYYLLFLDIDMIVFLICSFYYFFVYNFVLSCKAHLKMLY